MLQIPQTLERIQDITHVLVVLHIALYEVHLHLLKRSFGGTNDPSNPSFSAGPNNLNNGDFVVQQEPSHQLNMANDLISSMGNDVVIGDSAVLYVQVDSVHEEYFKFAEVNPQVAQSLDPILSEVLKTRQNELDMHVKRLDVTDRLSNQEMAELTIIDVPFYLSIGNDHIELKNNQALVVGDFATLGVVVSDDPNPSDLPCPGNCLRPYVQSIENLRRKPSVYSFLPRLSLYETDFFYQRFDAATADKVKPTYHGDVFTAHSSTSVISGDYLNAATLGFLNGNGDVSKVFVYGDESYDNYEWIADELISLAASAYYDGKRLDWAPDILNVVGNETPFWQGQKTSSDDIVVGSVLEIDFADPLVEDTVSRLFLEQAIGEKMKNDMYRFTIPYNISRDVSQGPSCDDADNVFIPSHTQSVFSQVVGPMTPDYVGSSPSPTVTSQPSYSISDVWYPGWTDAYCRNDGDQAPYMNRSPSDYLFSSAEECCKTHFQWSVKECRKKVSTLGGFGGNERHCMSCSNSILPFIEIISHLDCPSGTQHLTLAGDASTTASNRCFCSVSSTTCSIPMKSVASSTSQ